MGDHVFICYSRKDKDFVLKLATNLKCHGVPVWLDQWDIPSGANWPRAIDKALSDCARLLVVLSPESIESDEVQSEWYDALEEKKVVIPILYQKCHMPSRLKLIQHIDFTTCGPDDEKSLEQVLKALGLAGSSIIEPLAQRENETENANDWLKKGATFVLQNKYDEAFKAFDKATELNPQLELAWYAKGDAYFGLNMYDKAVKAYDKAIELNPQYTTAWNNKGLALYGQKKYHEAINALDKAIELNPQDLFVFYNKGLSLMAQGKLDEAIKAYDKAIELNPQNAWAWNYKGESLKRQDKYKEAFRAYDRAIEIDPQYAEAWYNKGSALKALGRTSEGNAAFTKAKELGYMAQS